jgi:hypothetical protein
VVRNTTVLMYTIIPVDMDPMGLMAFEYQQIPTYIHKEDITIKKARRNPMAPSLNFFRSLFRCQGHLIAKQSE